MKSKAFEAGRNAYKAGTWRDPGNPYAYGSSEHKEWDNGWLRGELEDY